MKEIRGKTGVLVGLELPLAGGGTEAGVRSPHGAIEPEEKHLRLRGKQLICGSLNGMRIRQSLPQPYLDTHRSPGRCSSWELEFRDCGANPGRGLLLTVENQIEGM